MTDQNGGIAKKLFFAALLVGSLDILAAFIDTWFTYHVTPDRVLIAIAHGAIGKQSDIGHFPMMVLGLLIHFFIAGTYTVLFYFVYPALKKALKYELLIGFLYGIFVWGSMRFAVLPVFSRLHFEPFQITEAIKPALILVCSIGIPLSFIMKKFSRLRH